MKKDLWWGYSKKKGWVVLDRKLAANSSDKVGKLIFYKCKDWSNFEEDRINWTAPHYRFSDRYLESIEQSKSEKMKDELSQLQQEFKLKRQLLHDNIVQNLHASFLKSAGLNVTATKKSSKKNRSSRCWSCKEEVSDSVDLECTSCGWIICSSCGACGCSYPKNTTQVKSRIIEKNPVSIAKPNINLNIFLSFKDASQFAKDNPGKKIVRSNDGQSWEVQ